MERPPLESEIKRLILRRHRGQCADTDQGLLRNSWPIAHRPPPIELTHALEVRAGHHNRLPVAGSRYDQPKRRRNTASGKNGIHVSERVRGQGSAVSADDDNIRALDAEFAAQFRLHVYI